RRSTLPDGSATASSSSWASAVTSATGAPPRSRAVAPVAEASAATRSSAGAAYLTHELRGRSGRRSQLRERLAQLPNRRLGDRVDDEDRLVGARRGELAQTRRDLACRALHRRDLDRTLPRGPIDGDEDAGAALDLCRSPARALRCRVNAGVERREALGRVPEPVVPAVPRVDVGERDGEHPLTLAPDHERRPARRRREQDAILDGVEPAGERDALACEQAPDDLERLLEPRDAAVERQAEGAELVLVPAGPDAEHEPAAADLVDRRGLLRKNRGRVEGEAGDERAERHPLGRRGERGQQRPDLPRPALGIAVEQVVSDPDRVEADLL